MPDLGGGISDFGLWGFGASWVVDGLRRMIQAFKSQKSPSLAQCETTRSGTNRLPRPDMGALRKEQDVAVYYSTIKLRNPAE